MRKILLILIAGMFLTASASAQRQTKLYIDNGSGTFTSISAPGQGGTVQLPASGTVVTTTSSNAVAAANIADDGSSGKVLTSAGGTPQWLSPASNAPSLLPITPPSFGPYTLSAGYTAYEYNTYSGSGPVAVYLPTSGETAGQIVSVINNLGASNAVRIENSGYGTFDIQNGVAYSFIWDGSNWFRLGNY